jgi:multidrug efflux system outer membrane protein
LRTKSKFRHEALAKIPFRPCIFCSIMILATVGVQGCHVPEPTYEGGQDLTLPDTWATAGSDNQGEVRFGWLKAFNDPNMEDIVAEALEHNRDLQVAAARLKVVEEGTIIGRAARLPQVSAFGSGTYAETRTQDGTGDLQPFVNAKNARLSLSAAWEMDLWARLSDLQRAAVEDYQAQLADYRGAKLSLAANTAKAWCNLIIACQQVTLARQTLDSFKRNYSITERNYIAGDTASSSLAVNFGRNQVASAERSLIARELSRDEAKRSLELFMGRYPGALVEERDTLPALIADVPAGLPSDLLMRRPDLAAAAADVRASAARASASSKRLLPSFSLSAGGSTTTPSLDLINLIQDPASIARSVTASFAAPIYQGGALKAQARQSLARNEAAIATFSSLALRAFREVESALATEHSLAAQEVFLETELKQANLAESQAYREYSEGTLDILSVLEAQRRAFNARNAMILLRNGRIQNRIDLHLALGGDFETPAPSKEEPPAEVTVTQRFPNPTDLPGLHTLDPDRH